MRVNLLFFVVLTLWIVGCSTEGDIVIKEEVLRLEKVEVQPISTQSPYDGVQSSRIYIFDDNKLVDIKSNLNISSEGQLDLSSTYSYRSECYFLANADTNLLAEVESNLLAGVTTTEEFENAFELNSLSDDNKAAQPLFVGYQLASDMLNGGVVKFERTFGVLDLEIESKLDDDVVVKSIKIIGASTQVNPFKSSSEQSSESLYDQTLELEKPLTASTNNIFYINQGVYQSAITVVIDAQIEGDERQLVRTLPKEISGSFRYVVRVLNNGTGGVVVDPFEDGGVEDNGGEAAPGYISVDKNNSTIPSDVTLSKDGTTINAPFYGSSEITLQLMCRDGEKDLSLEYVPNSYYEIDSLGENQFKLNINKALLNAGTEIWKVAVNENGNKIGYIYIEREGNPIRINGKMLQYLVDDSRLEVPTFIDGQLLECSLLSDKYTIGLEGDWVRFEPSALEEGRYVVQGGWKPNDSSARGEIQEAKLNVLDTEGKKVLEYPMTRRNYSIPVVYINGNWWSKFAMRGDRTSYEDQIQSSDPLASIDLHEHLQTCSSEDFLKIAGGAYQSTHKSQLTLTKRTDSVAGFYLDGMTGGPRISTAAVGALSPGGFQLPTSTQLETIFPWYGNWGTNPAITENYVASGGFTNENDSDSRYRFRPYRRTNMSHDSVPLHYGYTEIVKLSGQDGSDPVGEPIVFIGMGHATSDAQNAYNSTYQYYAISRDSKMFHIGTQRSDNKFYVWSSSGMSDAVTYTHRCIKTPNDFILD